MEQLGQLILHEESKFTVLSWDGLLKKRRHFVGFVIYVCLRTIASVDCKGLVTLRQINTELDINFETSH